MMAEVIAREVETVAMRLGADAPPTELRGEPRRVFVQHALSLELWRRYRERFDIRQVGSRWFVTWRDTEGELYTWTAPSSELTLLHATAAITEMDPQHVPPAVKGGQGHSDQAVFDTAELTLAMGTAAIFFLALIGLIAVVSGVWRLLT